MDEDFARLDPRAARLLQMLRAGERQDGAAPSVEARRESLRTLADLTADPVAGDVARERPTCRMRDGAELPLVRYVAGGGPGGAAAAMLYLHGGGWVAGDLETHSGVCAALARASGCHVFALDYRRAPEHPFPVSIQDAADALRWLGREAQALGVDPRRLVLAGDSAGANLAAACLLEPEIAVGVALQLLICPILDLPRTTGSRERYGRGFFLSAERLAQDARDYLQGADPAAPQVSPLRAGRLAHLPPTLIHAAECDPFRDEALAYAERLQAEGVAAHATVHPGMIHYFYALPHMIPYARGALGRIGAEVKAMLALE